ncbi:MAG TPA: DUF5683 domain-containing protein [Candidatus Kapabacteria bacterium]|jgi:hypothetical protein|nr:DUF5683 domain-containing protein [Candidatus Kapabacteria bacterium]
MHRLPRLIFFLVLMYALAAPSPVRAQSVDTANTANDTTSFHMTKSPLKAVLLSAVIPGAGQVYLDQTWKVPIIWGIAGGFLYGALKQNSRYYGEINLIAQAKNAIDIAVHTERREYYRDDRDRWWIFASLTYIATLLDSYISANLFDFDVSNSNHTLTGTLSKPVDHSTYLNVRVCL